MLAGSQSQSTIITPLSACLGKAKHIRGRFLRINATSSAAIVRDVVTNSEITIDYDILVIACGVGYSSPIRPAFSSLTMADRLVEVETFLKTVQKSNTILINGGGLIGVELAGELVHRYYKRKSITLLNRSPLLNALPPKAGELATKWLQARGVNVLMDELQSSSITSTNAVTVSGKRLNFDILIDCRGLPESISSSSSKDSYHPPPFDLDGYMTVNQFLQAFPSHHSYHYFALNPKFYAVIVLVLDDQEHLLLWRCGQTRCPRSWLRGRLFEASELRCPSKQTVRKKCPSC